MASIITSTTASNATKGHRRIDNIGTTLFTRIGYDLYYCSDGSTWTNIRSTYGDDDPAMGSVAIDSDPAYTSSGQDAFWWITTNSREYFKLNSTTHELASSFSFGEDYFHDSFVYADTLAGTAAPQIYSMSNGAVKFHAGTDTSYDKWFLTSNTISGDMQNGPTPEVLSLSSTQGSTGSTGSARFLSYETSWQEVAQWTGNISSGYLSPVQVTLTAFVDFGGMEMRFRVKRGGVWSAYSSTRALQPDWQGGQYTGAYTYTETLDPGTTDTDIVVSVEMRRSYGTHDCYVSLFGGYDGESDYYTNIQVEPEFSLLDLQTSAQADSATEVAVVTSGSDAFGVWASESGNAWDIKLRKVTGYGYNGAGSLGTVRTITAASLTDIKDLSVAEHSGEIFICYTDGNSVFLRSRDAADTTTTNYTVPSLVDGGYKAVTLSLTDEGDPVLAVITTNSGDVSVAHYDVSADTWAGWKTIAATNGVADSLSGLRNLHTDDTAHFIWTNDQGASKDVRHESVTLAQIANTLPVADAAAKSDFDATEAEQFDWTFNDDDAGDYQTAYQLVIYNNSTASLVHDTGKTVSTDNFYSLPGGTLSNNIEYYYQVRVWDNKDDVGSYSTERIFHTSAKPTTAITSPATDGATVTTPNPTVTWTYSDPESELQTAYRVRLYDANNNLLWDSGKESGTDTSLQVEYNLANNTSYQLTAETWDAHDVKSDEALRSFNSSFTPPTTPLADVSEQDAFVSISINNQGDTNVVSNEVWRSEDGETAIRVAEDIPINGTYKDYAVKSGSTYTYFVRAVASSDAYADSDTSLEKSIDLLGAWIHRVGDPQNTVHQFLYDGKGRNDDWAPNVQQRVYAGRVNPTFEYGEQENFSVTVQLQLADSTDKSSLDSLVRAKNTLCYRDSRGRKVFGIIESISFSDAMWGHEASVTIRASNYLEEV